MPNTYSVIRKLTLYMKPIIYVVIYFQLKMSSLVVFRRLKVSVKG